MNKGELIEAVAASENMSKAAAESCINAVLCAVGKGVAKDEKVQIAGFGTFSIRTRKARKGRNPRTGEEIMIKASKTVGFKAGKALREAL
jgi:DNA-binding protein HU-beta